MTTQPKRSTASPPDWPLLIHHALLEAGVTLVGYVPDAGHQRLIELCQADDSMRAVPLTTEEEGVGLATGAWLGGARTVLLMQSSGVGNVVNALGMARECRVPVPIIVTMRGEEGETNPWQVPMGRATREVLEAMDTRVSRVERADGVAAAVEAALAYAFDSEEAVAVLIAQSVIGVKHFQARGAR